MRALDFIKPFRSLLTEFATFLKQQNMHCQQNAAGFHSNLITINNIYLLNIEHTLTRLDKMHLVLQANLNHAKATTKVFDYAARAKLALQRTLRSAQLKVAVYETYNNKDPIALEEAQQCDALFKKFLAIAPNITSDLPLPQKLWLNQDLLAAELQYHQELGHALQKGSETNKEFAEFAEEVLLVEQLQNLHIFPSLNMTSTTYGHLQETKNKAPSLPRARL